ncbi:thioesterase II family protein [Streptomyces sp. NPDC059173]|uniref:thioesterase II family protein n=1 Tax=Streptomyces sp. NPDC059173 TaxID=3346756 RepID=UPI0036905D9C
MDRPAVRVFLFHHAGGTHHFFRDWAGLFPADWEILLMEAPGRGNRPEQRCRDIGELAERLHREIHPLLDRPYGFFGHSMGGLVCTETTRRLRAQGCGPRWVGLSAWGADRATMDGLWTNRSLLPDPQLRSLVLAMGGTSPEILKNDAIWRRFSPAIRDDLRLLDTTNPSLFAPVADVPHSLFGGEDDATLPPERLNALAQCLSAPLHLHPGGHFYLREHRRSVARQIAEDLGRALRGGTL